MIKARRPARALLQLLNTSRKGVQAAVGVLRKGSRRQPVAFAQEKGDGILLFQPASQRGTKRFGFFRGPQSGRAKLARQFINGFGSSLRSSVREADDRPSLAWLPALVLAIAFTATCHQPRSPDSAATAGNTREVIDEAGRHLLLPLHIERIVSLAPNLTEIVYAVGAGDRLAGDTDYCDYPPAATKVAKVGDTIHPSVERIIALKPQLVLVSTASQLEAFTNQLDQQQISVYVTNPQSLEDVFRSIQALGDLFDEHDRAAKLLAELRRRAADVDQTIKSTKPVTVFYQVSGEPLYTIGRESYLTDLVRRAGGASVTADVPGAFPRFSDEAALAARPEAIILPAGDAMGEANSKVAAPLRNSPAVLNNRVYKINDSHLSRPGPRLVDGLEEMARALHPGAFK